MEHESGRLIGATRYDNYDPEASEIEIGWTFLARPYWGGLYNSDLKQVMLDYAFRSVETVVFLVDWGNLRHDEPSRNSAQPRVANVGGWCFTRFISSGA